MAAAYIHDWEEFDVLPVCTEVSNGVPKRVLEGTDERNWFQSF